MTTNQEDAPFGVFRLGYSLFVWGNVALLTVIMIWVFWTMFMNTPSGTLSTERYAAALPTREMVALEAVGRFDPSACIDPGVAVCASCHLIDNEGSEVCPSLLEIATVADERIADSAYAGSATTARDYIRESIQNPSAYLVSAPAGKTYPVMPENLEDSIDLDRVVEYIYCAGGGAELEEAADSEGDATSDSDSDVVEAEDDGTEPEDSESDESNDASDNESEEESSDDEGSSEDEG